MNADPSSSSQGDDVAARPPRKVWVTPTIEEAEASKITEGKSAANVETTYVKAGS